MMAVSLASPGGEMKGDGGLKGRDMEILKDVPNGSPDHTSLRDCTMLLKALKIVKAIVERGVPF